MNDPTRLHSPLPVDGNDGPELRSEGCKMVLADIGLPGNTERVFAEIRRRSAKEWEVI